MSRSFRVVAATVACAAIVGWAAPRTAQAFVSPGWRQASLHRGIVGTWQLVDIRGKSISLDPDDKALVLDISTTTIRVTFEQKSKELRYEAVVDEDGMLAVTAYNESGEHIAADVLLATPNAMTIYLLEGDDDIGIAMHFERIR